MFHIRGKISTPEKTAAELRTGTRIRFRLPRAFLHEKSPWGEHPMAEMPWHRLFLWHETEKFLPGTKSNADGSLPSAATAGLNRKINFISRRYRLPTSTQNSSHEHTP
jgi:hypothetical protein